MLYFLLRLATHLPRLCRLALAFVSTALASFESSGQLSFVHEGLPRWPNLWTPTGCLRFLDWFGTVVFAMSGSLAGASSGADLNGCILIGTVTAVGGGTLRDALVLNTSPSWVDEWEYLVISAVSATVAVYVWHRLRPGCPLWLGLTLKAADCGEGDLMQWGDAIGVGAFAVIGAMNGIRGNRPMIVSALCGVMTATFGGMVRDMLLHRPVRILHPYADTYAPIALVGAVSYLGMQAVAPLQQFQGCRILISVTLTVFLRQQAWTNGWRLPHWNINQEVVQMNQDPRVIKIMQKTMSDGNLSDTNTDDTFASSDDLTVNV
ncbi:hypothetical protein DYB38_004022 [Aphanomyces astaci]|uniref:Glycine transporter domain-containing protein n=2 Tax=Aphanomyces astaci TaxID=112090 RepID=A0A397C5J4_APHAT|nr:hypothetical protein DYB38_004022 [Aphanomyces astaci]